MTMTLLQLQALNCDHFLTSFQPTSLHCYFTFLLTNDVRITTFTHQLLSRKISSHSATVSVAVLRVGYAEVVFVQPGGKLETPCDVALGRDYPTSR